MFSSTSLSGGYRFARRYMEKTYWVDIERVRLEGAQPAAHLAQRAKAARRPATLSPVSAQVAEGVTRLGTEIVNWYVVEDGGRLTAVDAGLPGYGQSLETDLRAAGHNLADIDAVVLTHSDSDHMGMAAQMR